MARPHPSLTPVANFVSIKLSGESNYNLWKKQMMCLLTYHNLHDVISGNIHMDESEDDYDEKKSIDMLVKGWIFGTLTKDVLFSVVDLENAHEVWMKFESIYSDNVKGEDAKLYAKIDHHIVTENAKVAEANLPLARALSTGDWSKTEEIFSNDPTKLIAKVDWPQGDSALHIAIFTCLDIKFVENILKEISPSELLRLVSNPGYTTLHIASIVDYVEAAQMLVDKCPNLLFITDAEDKTPVLVALLGYNEKTFRYLYEACKLNLPLSQDDGLKNPFEGKPGSLLLCGAISRGLIDIAHELVCNYPSLAISNDEAATPLWFMANDVDLYFRATDYNFYERFIYSHLPTEKKASENDNEIRDIENAEENSTKFIAKCKRSCFFPVIERILEATVLHVPHIKLLKQDKLKHQKARMILEQICKEISSLEMAHDVHDQYNRAFNIGVLRDNREALEMIIRYHNTTYNKDALPHTLVKYHCENVLNLVLDMARGGFNHMLTAPVDNDNNNILHLAGRLAPIEKLNVVSGAALQMQKEVQWFKRIEECTLPSRVEEKNLKGQTPIMVFREEHEQLRIQGEEWMKRTSKSYSIIAGLILTCAFAAGITVPGGNDQNTGVPIFERKLEFVIFAISIAISFFASTTSVLCFLCILTTRYHEDDFLYKLPKRLIAGLVMLFFSISSMMVAFCAILYIMFGRGTEWIIIPIVAVACVLVVSYMILQYPLLHELVVSTYGDGIYKKGHRKDRQRRNQKKIKKGEKLKKS